MPTGYTAKLVEQGQTFPEFALTCARAFGALIDMRDGSLDAEIPEKFEQSTYHKENLKEAKENLAALKKLSKKKQLERGRKARQEDIERCEESIAKTNKENKRIDDMIDSVRAWYPPSKEHHHLKDFMFEQLNISRNDVSYHILSLEKAKAASDMDYFKKELSSAEWYVKYHSDEIVKEENRYVGKNEWVSLLRKSLGK